MRLKLDTDKMIAEKDGGIGWMIFNNPARRNAMSMAMREAVPVILDAYANDPDVRVVVMKGAGDKAFVSGADISEFEEKRASPEAIKTFDEAGQRASAAYKTFEKPLIAMIRGFCVGGGMLTALRADLRIASDDSQFGIPAARLGLGYEYGGVETLTKLVGPAVAAEILFTARRLNAEEALRVGLVNRVVAADALDATVREIAAMIADNAPLTVKSVKAAIKETQKDPDARDLAHCKELVRQCFASQDYIEGRRAFMEKRKAVFVGR